MASVCTFSLVSCSAQEAPELLEPVGVVMDTAVVEVGDIISKTSYEAVVKPYVEELMYESSGVVYNSYVKLGDDVQEGDILLEIDTSQLEEEIASAKEQIEYNEKIYSYTNEQLEIQAEIAELEYEKLLEYSEIWAQYYEDVNEAEELKAQLEQEAQELKEQLEQEIEELKAQLEQEAEVFEESLTQEEQETEISEEIQEEINLEEQIAELEEEIANIEIIVPEVEVPTVSEVTDSQLAQEKANVETAQMNVSQAKETQSLELSQLNTSLEALENSVVNNVLVAPFSGTVVYFENLLAGDSVKAYETVICIANSDDISVNTEYIGSRAIDTALKVVGVIGEQEYELEYVPIETSEYIALTYAGVEVTSTFNFVGDSTSVEAGDFVNLEIYTQITEDVLRVPVNAVYGSGYSGYYVYIVEDGELIKTDVTQGLSNDSYIQITEGLQEGDIIYVQN